MPRWRFWDKSDDAPPADPAEPEVIGRFGIRPRTDLVGGELPSDDGAATKVSALRKRRDAVLFDVEQATLAGEPVNPWLERIATIDEARRAVEADLRRLAETEADQPGMALPATPVQVVEVEVETAPRVVIRVGGAELVYVEDLDWAERGHQIAPTELHLESGDVGALLPSSIGGRERAELIDVVGRSLFAIATDAGDRVAAGRPVPVDRPLGALAVPDFERGGWIDINGNSPRRRAHAIRKAELRAEQERLWSERERELEEMARWWERLPVARRRLRDVDEQIAAALAGDGGGGR